MTKDFFNKEHFDNLVTVLVYFLGFGLLAFAMWLFKEDQSIRSVIIAGILYVVHTLTNFRWGSSRSATRKDETINQMLNPDPGSTEIRTTQTRKPDDATDDGTKPA